MRKTTAFLLAAFFVWGVLTPISVISDETVTDKVQEGAEDTGKELKEGARKLKRGARKATGTNRWTDDVKDSAGRAGDEIEDKANDIKKKAD